MPKKLIYTGGRLDRAAERRRDADWIAGLVARDDARVVVVWRDHSLVVPGDPPAAHLLAGGPARAALGTGRHVTFLGLIDDLPYFAADLSHLEEDDLPAWTNGEDRSPAPAFEDLRRIGGLLAADEAAVLAFARGMMHWHKRQRFCPDCGSPTEAREGGHVHACIAEACGRHHFPRTDPAVIMLVHHVDEAGVERCLLGRSHRWQVPMYSTLAGFVEPGESLEEAVAREVLEEAGIRVADVTYKGSQPWPFPQSLMLGFHARALNADIVIEEAELREALWFTRDEIARFGEFYGENDPERPRLPRKDSIARFLIDDWLNGG